MSGGGGNNNALLDTALMIGAGVATGGVADAIGLPALLGGGLLGTVGADALTGAVLQGGVAGLTGGNVGQSALMGGIGGAASGYLDGLNGVAGPEAINPAVEAPVPPVTDAGPTTIYGDSAYNYDPIQTPNTAGINAQLGPNPGDVYNAGDISGMSAQGRAAAGAEAPSGLSKFAAMKGPLGLSMPSTVGGGIAALTAMNAEQNRYGVPGIQNTSTLPKYVGAQGVQYPTNYGGPSYTPPRDPYAYPTVYAASGGIMDAMPNSSIGPVERMSNQNAIGGNSMFPQSQINSQQYSNPLNRPMSTEMFMPPSDTNTDPYTGQEKLAVGGTIGNYSDGGQLLKGPGTGISDDIPATIGKHQPARLANNEFVLPARIVSEIGQGSTDAGAKKLYEMMDRVQKARKKTMGKGNFANNSYADREVDKLI